MWSKVRCALQLLSCVHLTLLRHFQFGGYGRRYRCGATARPRPHWWTLTRTHRQERIFWCRIPLPYSDRRCERIYTYAHLIFHQMLFIARLLLRRSLSPMYQWRWKRKVETSQSTSFERHPSIPDLSPPSQVWDINLERTEPPQRRTTLGKFCGINFGSNHDCMVSLLVPQSILRTDIKNRREMLATSHRVRLVSGRCNAMYESCPEFTDWQITDQRCGKWAKLL